MTEITLPRLGESSTDATVERYYKQVGDQVEPGDPLLVVRTQRFEWDVPATTAGTIGEILVQPGAAVSAGAALVRLNGAIQTAAVADSLVEGRGAKATPLARKIAAMHGLDLAALSGSGPRGTIRRVDVLAALGEATHTIDTAFDSCFSLNMPTEATIRAPRPAQEQAFAAVAPARPTEPQRLLLTEPQRLIAAQLLQSKRVIPHALTAVEVDLSRVLAYIATHGAGLARRRIELSVTACVAHAAVAALARHRLLNSAWSDDGIIVRGRVHLGVASGQSAAGGFALLADAADLSLQGLARALGNRWPLADAVEQLSAATFTICDEGGTRWRHGIVAAAQGAVLTLGAIERRPYVVESPTTDTIVIRPLTILTLAYDARCSTQLQADAFLMDLKFRLEHFSPL
jgi:pyruvate/2-oxoglutarate dehydrogenase complex dihydrolipoamide acyltransferase (E2) component